MFADFPYHRSRTFKLSVALSVLQFNAMVAFWLASAVNIPFYQAIAALSSYHGLAAAIFLLATGLIIFAYYLFALQLLSWRFNAKWVAGVLVVMSAMGNYFVSELGIDINQGQILNMMQTDLHEMLDLVSWRAAQLSVLTIILPLLVIWQVRLPKASIKTVLLQKLLTCVATLAIIAGLVFTYYGQYAPMFREHRNLKEKLNPNNSISGLLSYGKHYFKLEDKPLLHYGTDAKMTGTTMTGTATDLPRLMVLVVGETGRAESFSLNGYHRDTNPELAKLDVLNFSNVASCGTETAVSVPCMFSGMPRQQYDASLASHREGLLDIAKRAGYEVTWIDNNSGCKRTCDRVSRFGLPLADKQRWCNNGECYDDILLDSVDAYLSQLKNKPHPANQLIVLHQMGSHGPAYYKRYPAAFQKFVPSCDTNAIQNCSHASLINSYDNTIVYTDHILAGLIARLKQQTGFQTGMWYVSDHGESTGEHGLYLHGAPYVLAPSQQTHVPMILWFSKAWQQQQPTLLPCLQQQLGLPRSQDNLFPTLLSVLHINTRVIDPQFNMLSLCHA
ncbi:phosphoethanolamine transferase [Alkanindiges illinoisensis]|uniref:Phosphoethanolamine--lipid A transferase n=1 Tax=Alkanindiges illinoisensis TaxID=197183 RepID=A0A4Y7XAT2_9GAMM|nr:phosphoethanolamine--lipid A transferase [Alkanindiges illinoisensis]TEU24177.1 phosphoethanolamine--lipid A transferase [Alkanindiges illinoisensis]